MRDLYLVWVFFVGLSVSLVSGCKKDEPVGLRPPETRLFLDNINRQGEDRLQTVVNLFWSGDDADGIVTGYEISLDNVRWDFTTKTDSTFRFNLQGNSDTTNIQFYVRAIDDAGLRDPSPARLIIPIKNTPPVAVIDSTFYQKDTVQSVLTYRIRFTDTDGPETIDSIFVQLNNGLWYSVPKFVEFISFVPTTPKSMGTTAAFVYFNDQKAPQSKLIDGFNVGQGNEFKLRVKDQAGAFSKVVNAKRVHVLKQNADLLVLDGWTLNPKSIITYENPLKTVFGGYDYLDFTKAGTYPVTGNITLRLVGGLYKKIFWFTGRGRAQTDLMERAEVWLEEYMQRGGKLLINVPLPSDTDPAASFFRFTPIDSLSRVELDAQLASDSILKPTAAANGWPVLKNATGVFITLINPFYPKAGAEPIYEAQLSRRQGGAWTRSRVVAARLKNAQNKTTQLFFSIPLHWLTTDNDGLTGLFRTINADFE